MSGIFRHIPGICQPISHTRYMSRICLTYSFRVISSLCLEYSRHILPRIIFPSRLVICLDYSSACSSNAIGMPLLSQYTYFGCQGCLIFSAKRGGHACQRQSVSRCSAASIVMSLLQQIPEKYHDHDDVHIKLAQCTARKESKSISKIEYLGYICKIIRSKLISFEFSSQPQETNSENTNQETDSPVTLSFNPNIFHYPCNAEKIEID